jgi:bacteriocin biosynthesis cyclodehydratase domain-containing protein
VNGGTELAALARHASVEIPARPLLVPWVRPIELGDGLIELRSPETFYPLRHQILSAAFRAVGDRLDGTQEVETIAADPPDDLEPTTILFLLKLLRSLGLLLDGAEVENGGGARGQLLFLGNFTVAPGVVQRRLAAATVEVAGPEALAELILRRLRVAGCERAARVAVAALGEGAGPELTVVCADAPARSHFAAANEAALRTGRPWLRVAVHNDLAWLGPLVIPGETACIACMEMREAANARSEGSQPDFPLGSLGSSAPMEDLLAVQAAAEAARFLGRFAAPATVGGTFELSAKSPATQRHPILRDPECLACGSLSGAPVMP